MGMVDFIMANPGWSWVILGVVLLGLELLVPGVFLVWLGGAALLTGLTVFQIGIGGPFQFGLFGLLSLALVGGWLIFSRRRAAGTPKGEDAFLNSRTGRLLGREATLVEPISEGVGRIQIDDSLWRVEGPDLPQGAKVRVTGARGAVLEVEPVR